MFIASDEEVDLKEKKIEQKAKKHRKRKVTINFMLVPIITILVLLLTQCIMNNEHLTYLFNKENYVYNEAVIKEVKVDNVAFLLPKIKITYTYNDINYECEKYFIMQHLFGITKEVDSNIPIYINKLAPNYCLIKTNFFDNKYNTISMCLIVYCFINMIIKCINNIQYFKQQKQLRKKKKHKKQIKKAIRKMYQDGGKNGKGKERKKEKTS